MSGDAHSIKRHPLVASVGGGVPHGRLAWNIHIDGGTAVLDVSVMPSE